MSTLFWLVFLFVFRARLFIDILPIRKVSVEKLASLGCVSVAIACAFYSLPRRRGNERVDSAKLPEIPLATRGRMEYTSIAW